MAQLVCSRYGSNCNQNYILSQCLNQCPNGGDVKAVSILTFTGLTLMTYCSYLLPISIMRPPNNKKKAINVTLTSCKNLSYSNVMFSYPYNPLILIFCFSVSKCIWKPSIISFQVRRNRTKQMVCQRVFIKKQGVGQ